MDRRITTVSTRMTTEADRQIWVYPLLCTSMEFRLLGPVEATRNGQQVSLGRRQERLLLGLLLLEPGRPVAASRLALLIWGDDPPANARRTLHTYVARLRASLRSCGITVATRGESYSIDCDPQTVDLHRFTTLVAAGRALPAAGQQSAALREALALWRGPVLADVAPDDLRLRLDATYGEQYLTVVEARFEADLASGQCRKVIGPLVALLSEHTTRESLVGLLMRALCQSGRQTEALAAYRRFWAAMDEEYGVEPSLALQTLHHQILHQDPALSHDPAVPVGRRNNLPPDIAGFHGRSDEIAFLDQAIAPNGSSTAVVISAVTGMPGVGKTALAVHWAGRVADQYPDGVFYVDLRGYSNGRTLLPIDALVRLLAMLGIPHDQIPVRLDQATDRYRSAISGLRVLVVIDNARTADQVRPLLPGGRSIAVVTSRDRLTGLVARDGARALALDVLSLEDSIALLRSVTGVVRWASDPESAEQIAALCGGLPLALRIAGATVAESGLPIANYLAALQHVRTAALQIDGDADTSVTAVFDYSYQQLSVAEQRLLRLLGGSAAPGLPRDAIAALACLPAVDAATLLTALTSVCLIDDRDGRYWTHDLLGSYAAELASAAELRMANDRLYTWYFDRVAAAARRLYPSMLRLDAAPDLSVEFDSDTSAMEWLTAEHAGLVAVVRHAADAGSPFAWLITDSLRGYFWSVRTNVDWIACAEDAIRAATTAGARQPLGAAHFSLGTAYDYLSRFQDAATHYDAARREFEAVGWNRGLASVTGNYANLSFNQGRLSTAAALYEQATDAYRALGLTPNVMVQQQNLANVYFRMGRLREGLAAADEGVAWFGAHDQHQGLASALLIRGVLQLRLSDSEGAIDTLGRAKKIYDELGSADGGACVAEGLAEIYRDRGQLDLALELAEEAYETARNLGEARMEAGALNTLASVHLRRGDADLAHDLYSAALPIAAAGSLVMEVDALLGLAQAALSRGNPAVADAHARRALAICTETGYGLAAEEAHRLLARPR